MTLPRKLTIEEQQLKAELKMLNERISRKILNITYTHQKLPYDRLAKGRQLKESCAMAIKFLDEGNLQKLEESLKNLRERGIKI